MKGIKVNSILLKSSGSGSKALILIALTCAILLRAVAHGDDAHRDNRGEQAHWPNWRGPSFNGCADASANPPVTWNATDNIVWKTPIPGRGINTPIVWGDKIFLLTAIPQGGEARPDNSVGGERSPRGERGGQRGGGRGAAPAGEEQSFVVLCLSRNDGSVIWQKEVQRAVPHEGLHDTNTYSSPSAVTDGRRLYASFGSFGIYCLTLDGDIIWSRDLGEMRTRNAFGEGGSPALYGETLVVPWDHEGQSRLFALNAQTGEIQWQVDRDEPTTWATPFITDFNGRHQVITNGTVRVRSYDLATGELLWECAGQVANPIPTPLRIDDLVICMTGYRGFAIQAIQLSARGNITGTAAIVWSRNDAAPYVSSAVLIDDKLVFTKSRDAIASVVNARTGDVLVPQTRLPGLDTLYASPIAAGGRIYFAARNGQTTVVELRDNELKTLATNDLGETIDASPVAIGNYLLLRGDRHLYCIGEK